MIRLDQRHAALVLIFGLAGCGEPDRRSIPLLPRCVEGRSETCTCSDGRTGAQVCGSDRTFGPCMCEGPLPMPDATVHEDASEPVDLGGGGFDADEPDVGRANDDDAGFPDFGVPDPPDFGVPDFGVRDSGVVFPDASSPDARPADSGTRDSGPRDGGGVGQFCFFDSMCNPPVTICENNMCVTSCTLAGCGAGETCLASTGRCVPSCVNDSNCMVPDEICESGGCVPGCASLGGPTCSSPEVCNTATGRCGPCTTDSQCGPPSEICVAGSCVPGCSSAGGAACTGSNVCQYDTGRCEAPGTAALGASCTRHNDCASSYCHAFGGGASSWCVSACGTNRDCASGFSCVEDNGARMCVGAARVSGATFIDAAGAMCTTDYECQSNFCASSACVDTCAEDSDCLAGTCRWYSPVMNEFVAACNGPLGTGANGAACTGNGDCRSGVCDNSTCAELCSNTGDCDATRVCSPVDNSVCLQELFPGLCLQWEINFVSACIVATRGAGAVGAACTTETQCQSGICHVALGRCTDTCSRNGDCPASDRCKSGGFATLGMLGLQTADANVCVPRGY